MSSLIDEVDRSVAARKLLRRGQGVVIAASGGLDSMVLLHALHRLAAKHHWRLVVAHFNHRLRGKDSDADELFIREAASKLELEFIGGRGDVGAFARGNKISIEMAARKLRHDFFARAAKRLKITTVALAHHADDQVELFFLRLLRGAGGEGIGGMQWSSVSPSDPAVRLVRPLLDQSKAGLRRFASEQAVAFREDATNARPDFLRNRIRNKLLPLLSLEYQPAIAGSVRRTMDIAGTEADFVRCAAKEWLERKRRLDFEKLHQAVQRQVIRIQLVRLGIAPDFDRVEHLRNALDAPVTVEPGLAVSRESSGRIVKQVIVRVVFNLDQLTLDLKPRGTAEFGGREIRWQLLSSKTSPKGKPTFKEGCEYFDADKVGTPVTLRHWRRGDRFQPIGFKAPVKLQDLFTNGRVSRAQRHQLVVATTAAGELFWVEGLRMAQGFKLDHQTVRRLKWLWLRRQSVVAGATGAC